MEPTQQRDPAYEAAKKKLEELEHNKSAEQKLEEFAKERRTLIKELKIDSFLEYGSEPER